MFISHLAAIRTLLSQCAAYRTWVAAADASSALPYILLGQAAAPAYTRYAIVGPASRMSWEGDAAAGPGVAAGTLQRSARLTFVRLMEDGDSFGETLATSFCELVEAATLQLLAQRGGSATPEDSYFVRMEEADDHLLPEDDDHPGTYPPRTRKAGTDLYGYMLSLDFHWST